MIVAGGEEDVLPAGVWLGPCGGKKGLSAKPAGVVPLLTQFLCLQRVALLACPTEDMRVNQGTVHKVLRATRRKQATCRWLMGLSPLTAWPGQPPKWEAQDCVPCSY